MAKYFTEKFLSNNLDGFGKNGSISLLDCLNSKSTLWQPVLQTTIFTTINDKKYILNGTRKASANPTHPNVVSTPTSLVPREFAAALYKSLSEFDTIKNPISLDKIQADSLQTLARFPESGLSSKLPQTDNMLSFIVANLLARKLGVSHSLEEASSINAIGECRLSMIGAGFSYAADSAPNADGVSEPLFEPLLMFGSVVELNSPKWIPEETESYSNLSWALLDDYQKGVKTKRIEHFNSKFKDPSFEVSADEITVCVRGLCLQTASMVIENSYS